MEIETVTQFRITLTPKEFRLVSKGLRGVLETAEDKAAALELQERLLVSRAQQAQERLLVSRAQQAQKAVTNIEQAKDDQGNRR